MPHLPYGTRIIHIAYDLQGWSGPFTTGLWQFFHASLFDPVMPFLLGGNRGKERSYGSRIIIGNAARLQRPDRAKGDLELAHADSTQVDLGVNGSVSIKYWVVRRPESSDAKSEPAASYVRADSAVSVTLFGQRQDTESRRWIKDNAKLPFLYKNLIVQIDADGLTPIGKRQLFASTRERATSSDLRTTIYDYLAEALQADDDLKRLNYEEKERLLQTSTQATNEKIRRRLSKFIKTRLKDLTRPVGTGEPGGTNGRVRRPPGQPTPPRNTNDSHLPSIPTRLKFKRDHMRIEQGGRSHVTAQIDAKNGYLPEHEDDLTLAWEDGTSASGKLRQTQRSRLLGGESRWFFASDDDATLGDYRLVVNLVTPNGVLSDTLLVTVAVPAPGDRSKNGSEPETGPDVRWVSREDWSTHDMDEHRVGYVTEDEETIIWINRNYRLLDKALSGRNLTPEAITTRADRYQYPIACGLWLQQHAQKTADPQPSERYVKQEMDRLAEAVLAAIDPDADAAIEESEE